jgi:hypothetical protein
MTRADLEDLLQSTGVLGDAALDEKTIVAGLQDALRVGIDRTVRSTSKTNGYFGDPRIRIPLPGQLETIADKLRSVGLAAQLDDLELTMNRAAESAAAGATPVFVDAITSMSFSDARSILHGGERAATDYFEASTRSELAQRFAPIVDASMQKVGVFQLYDQVAKRIVQLPFVDPEQLDLRAFVNDRALDGLFSVLAREEARIREDPGARTTDLLRRVFGR